MLTVDGGICAKIGQFNIEAKQAMHYQHTQQVPDKVKLAAAAAGLALGLTPSGFLARLAITGLLGATAYQFRSLTVEVDDEEIRLQFGDGPIKQSFLLTDLTAVKATKINPWQGLGIHWLGNGWIYNIYGLDAVEVSFSNGKRALIGTDEPEKLASAIDGRLIVVHP